MLTLLGSNLGCSHLSYYLQATQGQIGLLAHGRPVPVVINDPDTTETLRDRLRWSQQVLAFADRFGLPAGSSYRRYVDLKRDYVVVAVSAGPPDQLLLQAWCYPIAGCATYRGFFALDQARQFSADLEEAGLEVHLASVPAYSTLGWMPDPLLNTFMHWPRIELSRLLLHELAHQRLYVPGDTEFNESWASFVAHIGITRLHGDSAARAGALADTAFRRLLEDTLAELAHLYASPSTAERPFDSRSRHLAREREAVFARFRRSLQTEVLEMPEGRRYAGWLEGELNNVRLLAARQYGALLPAFHCQFRRLGENMHQFMIWSEHLGELAPAERKAQLASLLAAPQVPDQARESASDGPGCIAGTPPLRGPSHAPESRVP